jgi:hypothetical protein
MDVEQNPVAMDGAVGKDEKSNTAPLSKTEAIEHGEHDLLHEENVDTVLAAKMTLINDVSIEECLWLSPCNPE